MKAYDAVQEKSSGEQADDVAAIFQSRIDDFLESIQRFPLRPCNE